MEWQVSEYISDGYDGYQLIGYMDGYCGVPEYIISSSFINLDDISKLADICNSYSEKISNYNTYENPSQKILSRIASMTYKKTSLTNMLTAINEYEEE